MVNETRLGQRWLSRCNQGFNDLGHIKEPEVGGGQFVALEPCKGCPCWVLDIADVAVVRLSNQLTADLEEHLVVNGGCHLGRP